MTKYNFTVTIGASGAGNAVRLSTRAIAAGAILPGYAALYSATYLPCCRVSAQMQKGGTGLGYVGNVDVTEAGAVGAEQLAPADANTPGGVWSTISQQDRNTIDLSQIYIHGSVPGDIVSVTYWQA